MQELKIGLVGTGAIGRTHIERINHKLSGAKVIACADANKEFCKSVAEKYGLQAYETGEEMIAKADIDAVIVTTSDAYHEQYVVEAVKAGNTFSAKNPSHRLRKPASASSPQSSRQASSWYRSALCAATIRATAS